MLLRMVNDCQLILYIRQDFNETSYSDIKYEGPGFGFLVFRVLLLAVSISLRFKFWRVSFCRPSLGSGTLF